MAHSHDNTYIASLGFRDPDRNTSEHDLACEYISREDNIKKIALKFGHSFAGSEFDKEMIRIKTEEPINQESGSFQRTIGFMDVVANVTIPTGISRRNEAGEFTHEHKHLNAMIEVKIARMSIITTIRQIKFYKTYLTYQGFSVFILATTFPITHEEGELLDRENIEHIILGEDFKKYCEERDNRDSDKKAKDEARRAETLSL